MNRIVVLSLKCGKFSSCIVSVLTFAFTSFFLLSCSNKGEVEKLNKRIDSLELVDANRQKDLMELSGFITVLSDGLDSIASQEDMLFTNKGKEGILINREQLKSGLEEFEKMLERQKQRINQLNDSLKARGIKIEKLNNLVSYLNKQLDEKNREIHTLKEELGKGKASISQLKNKVSSLSAHNSELTNKVEKQMAAITVQDEMLNEGYIKIGTKKELKEGGYIKGGFLKKYKVNHDNLSANNCVRVDIRSFREITIPSKSPKILSQMPSSSYKLVKGNGVTILQILDANSFWSISNFLIIQAD